MAQSAVIGVYRMGAWVGDKVKGLASHISMGRQKTDTRQAAPAAPAPAHESGMEHGA